MVAGDDLAAEVCARALAAAGVGRLRLVRQRPPAAPVLSALMASNPELGVDVAGWPGADADGALAASDGAAAGAGWLAALSGVAAVVRSGFDDDAMLRAAVRLGIPAIVLRASADTADVLSFRRHGPCPHLDLDLPQRPAAVPSQDGPTAVLAAEMAAAEALLVLAGATSGDGRARHVRVTLNGAAGDAPPARATDLPWTPECFNCGGTAAEMSFS